MTDLSIKPMLAVYTVAFTDEDRENAQLLGDALYDVLSRPINHPTGFGPGALVFAAADPRNVNLDEAEHVFVIPALSSANTAHAPEEVEEKLAHWSDAIGQDNLFIAAFDSRAQAAVDQFGFTVLRNQNGDEIVRETIDAILLQISRSISPSGAKRGLALYHDGSKLGASIAKEIDDYVRLADAPDKFFGRPKILQDSRDWADNDDLSVFLFLRTDALGIQRTRGDVLLKAKQDGLACLTIEALQIGEPRSNPYGGNAPSLVWNARPGPVVTRAMSEWLRMHLFEAQAKRAVMLADLPPDPTVLTRAPELFDLAQPRFRGPGSQFVMYPDPELPMDEQRILSATQSRLHLATPTTAFRYLGIAEGRAAPLDGMAVSVSISDIPATDIANGIEQRHLQDVLVRLCRCLISTGARIAYGGDLRMMGFTRLISDLLGTYHQTALNADKRLFVYQAAHTNDDLGDMRPHDFRHLDKRVAFRERALLPSPSGPDRLEMTSLYYSDLRRMIAEDVQAGIVIGGQSTPKHIDASGDIKRPGYNGRFSGVVEEAWRTLEAGKPLYVVGGLGGAAGHLASLLLDPDAETPTEMRDETWRAEAHYSTVIAQFDLAGGQALLGLPGSLNDMAQAIGGHGRALLATDAAARAWNGLDIAENRALMTSRDPVLIASLILKGILKSRQRLAEGDLAVELIRGDIRQASKLDAVAVAVFDEAPILGAGRALDQALDNAVTDARAKGHLLTNIENGGIDADWLITASLGSLSEQRSPEERAALAARQIAEVAERHGLLRIGLVLFGGSLTEHGEDKTADEHRAIARAIVDAFNLLRGQARIVIFEHKPATFDTLRAHLETSDGVDLTTGVLEDESFKEPVPARAEGFLSQFFSGDRLRSTLLLPTGNAVSTMHEIDLPEARRREIGRGIGPNLRETPSLDALEARGAALAPLVIGGSAEALLDRLGDDALLIHHDLEASQIPFEMLRAGEEDPVAVRGGIRRVVSLRGLAVERTFARPPRVGKLKALLVINPTGDLPDAEKEGNLVAETLRNTQNVDLLPPLRQGEATVDAVLEGLKTCDLFHYCGHSFFRGEGDDRSGLMLAGFRKLTLDKVRDLGSVPRLAFVNSCEGGRTRAELQPRKHDATSFAEFFLGMGVEAYIGTYWEVGDTAALTFAEVTYGALARGETLDAAMLDGRRRLFKDGHKDWANYILYSRNAGFRLVR